MKGIRRIVVLAVLPAALSLTGAAPAVAASKATCSDTVLGVEVHGQHVVRDYVSGGVSGTTWPPTGGVSWAGADALPGGPGPGFHFPNGFKPGASVCLPQAESPGNVLGSATHH